MEVKRSLDDFKQTAREKAYFYEKQFHGCSQAILLAYMELLGLQDDLTLKAAGPLCAGMGMGRTCGALAGGIMVLGLKRGRSQIEEGIEGLIPGIFAAQQLVNKFEHEYGTTSCSEISKVNWSDLSEVMRAIADEEFIEKCAKVAGKTAEMVAEILYSDSF